MNRYNLKWVLPLILILFTLCGCTMEMGDGLFALPNLPTRYVQLQEQLERILASGAEYTYAETGTDKQAVQMIDLDADGQDEVIAFFMTERSSFRTYLFEYGLEGYYEVGYIEGYGRRLREVTYPEVDESGRRAIALSWNYDNTVNCGLSVSGYDGVSLYSMLETQYTECLFTDVDSNGTDELFVTVADSVTGIYTASAYMLEDRHYTVWGETKLDEDVRGIVNMQINTNAQGEILWYIDSAALGGGYVTDVLSVKEELINIASSELDDTRRVSAIYCTDIDNDGIIEVPRDLNGRFEWYGYSTSGRVLESVTYHNLTDGWYIFWPESWGDAVQAQRTPGDGVITTTFYVPSSGSAMGEVRNTLLNVYIFSGDDSDQHFQTYPNVRSILEVGNTIYGCMIVENDYPQYAITTDKIIGAFNLMDAIWTREER